MHSKEKGNIGHLSVAKELARLNLPVFTEVGDFSKTDLITIVNNKCIKIQVKYVTMLKSNIIHVYLTKSGPNYNFKYKEGDFDLFAIYIPQLDKICWIPFNYVNSKVGRTLTLAIGERKNKQTKGINFIDKWYDFNYALTLI